MGEIEKNLRRVRERMEHAAAKAGRDPREIKLMAVTKTVTVERIREAMEAGATIFGENYVQEARSKIEEIGQAGIQWHLIGHLQTNKARYAVRLFDLIHSVDGITVARDLDKRAAAEGKIVDCLIEVNLSQENSKFGISKEMTPELAHELRDLKNISLKGLMTMPPYADDPEAARPYFIALRELKEEIKQDDIPLSELSMGMSTDFAVAIEEGATIVRIGRAIFGERSV
ncbi:MAG: YggS family pyridoxal phosphate enzyme [Deltaproteobacteria bacterium RBG_16_54_11]|nr:MAG: YggS family pyridoxal phosphate enzyme [Deltaproteobacteria bacterium RBG_16_54_11]